MRRSGRTAPDTGPRLDGAGLVLRDGGLGVNIQTFLVVRIVEPRRRVHQLTGASRHALSVVAGASTSTTGGGRGAGTRATTAQRGAAAAAPQQRRQVGAGGAPQAATQAQQPEREPAPERSSYT